MTRTSDGLVRSARKRVGRRLSIAYKLSVLARLHVEAFCSFIERPCIMFVNDSAVSRVVDDSCWADLTDKLVVGRKSLS